MELVNRLDCQGTRHQKKKRVRTFQVEPSELNLRGQERKMREEEIFKGGRFSREGGLIRRKQIQKEVNAIKLGPA